MIRFLFRVCGALLLAASFASLVVDGTRSMAASTLVVTSLQQSLNWLAPLELNALWAASGSPWLLPRLTVRALEAMPTFVTFGGLGLLFLAVGRPRDPGIGIVGR